MRFERKRFGVLGIVVVGALGWVSYEFEPRILNFDDGPYYSREFDGEIDQLPLQSHVELTRFGNVVYVLESRLIERDAREESILVLRQPGGAICWQKVPLKPDGPLGAIGLGKNRTRLTWYGGWKVAIKPGSQESGYLYLGPFGGFRFFYHSW